MTWIFHVEHSLLNFKWWHGLVWRFASGIEMMTTTPHLRFSEPSRFFNTTCTIWRAARSNLRRSLINHTHSDRVPWFAYSNGSNSCFRWITAGGGRIYGCTLNLLTRVTCARYLMVLFCALLRAEGDVDVAGGNPHLLHANRILNAWGRCSGGTGNKKCSGKRRYLNWSKVKRGGSLTQKMAP